MVNILSQTVAGVRLIDAHNTAQRVSLLASLPPRLICDGCVNPLITGLHHGGIRKRDVVNPAQHIVMRFRKIVSLARKKWDAEQAEVKAKQELFEKRHGD